VPSARPLYPNKELVRRLRKAQCELCGRTGNAEVHHVRALADLTRPGQPQPAWAQAMARMRRKSLVTCGNCHDLIHGRQPVLPLAQ